VLGRVPALAETGAEPSPLVAIAGGALILGGLVVVIAGRLRRRRGQHSR